MKQTGTRMGKITRILVIGELLRVQPGNPYYADKTTRFFHELFRKQIAAATGMEPDFELAGDKKHFDRDRFYRLAGHDSVSPENWIAIAAGRFKPEAGEYLAECFENALVIGHEAGSLVGILESQGIPYLDAVVSPIRFMEDLHFAFRTNLSGVAEKLRTYMVGEDAIGRAAGLVKAYYLTRGGTPRMRREESLAGFPPDSLLLCGQTEIDLSLIRDGVVATFSTRGDEVRRLIGNYANVFFKAHPLAPPATENSRFIASLATVRPKRGNFYRMLCDDNLRAVAALSSGTLHEAPYFGKQAVAISHSYPGLARGGEPAGPGQYIMTTDDYFSPTFWRDILSPCLEVRDCEYFNFGCRANLLRTRLGMWWDYEIGRPAMQRGPLSRACRKVADLLDPSQRMREKLDPMGGVRRRIKRLLGE